MARATNLLTLGLSGKISVLVFRQQADGSAPVVAAMPSKSSKPPTPGATANRDRFRRASAYAKAIRYNQELTALYAQAVGRGHHSAYHTALADALNSPQLVGYQASSLPLAPGQLISVQATDDFEVVQVRVRLESPDGSLLEEGDARAPAPGEFLSWWYYAIQHPLPAGTWLVATAYDRPGNATEARWQLS